MHLANNAVTEQADTPRPICVAPKSKAQASAKKRKRLVNPLFDNRGFPNPHDNWEAMLPEVKAGRLIRKRKHNAPNVTDVDPDFGEEYDKAKHGNIIRTQLDLAHLTPYQHSIMSGAY